jgi:hypothetical protein
VKTPRELIIEYLYEIEAVLIRSGREAVLMTSLRPKTQADEVVVLMREFTLHDLRKLCGFVAGESETHDKIVLDVIDELSAHRKLKVWYVGIPKGVHHTDIFFKAQVGAGIRNSKIRLSEFEWNLNKPLSDKAFLVGGLTCVRPSEDVKAVRSVRDRVFSKRFPKPTDYEAMKKERRAEAAEEAQFRKDIHDSAELSRSLNAADEEEDPNAK